MSVPLLCCGLSQIPLITQIYLCDEIAVASSEIAVARAVLAIPASVLAVAASVLAVFFTGR